MASLRSKSSNSQEYVGKTKAVEFRESDDTMSESTYGGSDDDSDKVDLDYSFVRERCGTRCQST